VSLFRQRGAGPERRSRPRRDSSLASCRWSRRNRSSRSLAEQRRPSPSSRPTRSTSG